MHIYIAHHAPRMAETPFDSGVRHPVADSPPPTTDPKETAVSAAAVFAALDAATAAVDALTEATPADERARVEATYQAASAAMFDLL